jgi:tRNA 2-selenouridine synthase
MSDSSSAPPPPSRQPQTVTVDDIDRYDEIIDVRSESEFAEDHIPGAVNLPVLNDAERVEIGTMYKEMSPFDAKKRGAALVAINIACHLTGVLRTRPRDWKPLVYCWRGSGRSGAMAHVLQQIGWRTGRLEGGYKTYRKAVIDALEVLPARYNWRVVCGMTGTGKSRILAALADQDAQVLDLEQMAAHRGSVLGDLPDASQPAQKLFESRIWHRLRQFDPARPVFVESESKKIGRLRVPQALIDAMWASECAVIEADVPVRVDLLKDEYGHFLRDARRLNAQLDCLRALHGHDTINQWQSLAQAGEWDALTEDLLIRHYDPAYTRAIVKHYPALPRAPHFQLTSRHDAQTVAQSMIATLY